MASKRLYKTLKQLLREITKLSQAPIIQKLVQQLVALLNSLGRNLHLSRRMRRALKQFVRLTTTLRHTIGRQTVYWSLRANLVTRNPQAGFVLPTVTLLLLVTSLVVGMLVFRSFNRTAQVIGNRQQQVLFTAATPAIDRAKAKLEYLFRQDNLPALPSDTNILDKLANDTTYTLPDETRVDLDGNTSTKENAWTYRFNSDGRTPQTVVYSILTRSFGCPNNAATCTTANAIGITNNSDQAKARAFVVRNGPINVTGGGSNPNCPDPSLSPNAAWATVQGSALRKALQIDAFVRNDQTGATTTLEFQQDRQTNQGNKWGAWFRYDLEIFPGPRFNWNGAMYTSGNLIAQRNTTGLALYPISSPFSCVYSADASEVVINQTDLNRDGDPNDTGEFQGQILVGQVGSNTFSQQFDVFPVNPPYNATTVTTSNHSVTAGTPSDSLMDPVLLYTEDREQTRNSTNFNNTANRRTTWNKPTTFNLVRANRVYNTNYPKPFVDDTYRADNRWGPKPTYGLDNSIRLVTDLPAPAAPVNTRPAGTVRTGDLMTASNTAGDELTQLTRDTPPTQDEETFGLDGYWERRAIRQGLRFLVGQRLEVGNANGWNYTGQGGNPGTPGLDPLNPPPANAASGTSMSTRAHEQKQMRTLRDNLAAVQATAVYHYKTDNGAFPAACLATTSHPGTATSILNSVTFERAPSTTSLFTDFLNGRGTNGWEFNGPANQTTDSDFGTLVDNSTSALRVALTNLARFAGDPDGAFPPKQETSGSIVHPEPTLTMWGNFSELRRVIARLDGGTTYANLSPAEKSYLHTAACTLGMLAYNVKTTQDSFTATLADSGINWTNMGNALTNIIDSNVISNGSPMIGRPLPSDPNYKEPGLCKGTQATRPNYSDPNWTGCPSVNPNDVDLNDITNPEHPRNYFARFTSEEWIRALVSKGALTQAEADLLKTVIAGSQMLRDRTLGFDASKSFTGNIGGNYDPASQVWTNPASGSGDDDLINSGEITPNPPGANLGSTFKIGCDPALFKSGQLQTGSAKARLGLALVACSTANPPKYPALYYLFPRYNHGHAGAVPTSVQTAANAASPRVAFVVNTQPAGEPYVSNTYIASTGVNAPATNADSWYRVVGDSDNNGIENGTENPGSVALNPRPVANWVLPRVDSTTVRPGGNGILDNFTATGNTSLNRWVALMDKGIFNGRERMAVRVLDVDLDLLRRNSYTGGNYWLPLPTATDLGLAAGVPPATGALIYGFREDAVREDAIARPRSASPDYTTWLTNWRAWATATTDAALTAVTGYTMNAVGSTPNDPPLNPNSNISAKPVDFYPDPDRRPHGFRLRNGADLRRAVSGVPATEARGLSFISDNPVYIQGNFNIHSTDGSTPNLQEFTQTLDQAAGTLWSNFYTRNSLNTSFARASTDSWRSTEIIGDAITILSSNFVDGNIASGLLDSSTNGSSDYVGVNSYSGFLQPVQGATNNDLNSRPWVREDGTFSALTTAASPIKFSRRGFPVYCSNNTGGNGTLPSPAPSPLPACLATGQHEVEYGRETANPPSVSPLNITYTPPASTSVYRSPRNGTNDNMERANTATETWVNAVIVSGIVPSRQNQTYGGMHNFPRFLEEWDSVNLNIAGSLYQLNFSTYATAPFEQSWSTTANVWEPGQAAFAAQTIGYYGAPNRRWGFDTALQYSPAGIVARRFSTPSTIRSEFYRELPVDDPYIVNLRCARVSGNRVDSTVSGCPT